MLDQKTFLQGINYLRANYLNWNFDLNNDLMLKVWFKKFSNLDPNVFMQLVEKYTELNRIAPNSPAELLDLLRSQLSQKELDAEAAWQEVLRLDFKYGFIWWNMDDLYKELDSKPVLIQTVKELEHELKYAKKDLYLMNVFKKAYEKNLKMEVDKQTCLLLGNNPLLID